MKLWTLIVIPALATIVNNVWDRKYHYSQMKPVWDKYPTPTASLDKVLAPEMNEEIVGLLAEAQNKHDGTWKGV